jgi:hypothetical protein
VGGVKTAPAFATGQVVGWFSCSGLGVVVLVDPRPPPNWPTITIDVGILFEPAPVGEGVIPAGVNESLFVRLILRPPVALLGTVMSTGDHWPADRFGRKGAQVAAEPVTAVPQL